MQEEKTNRYYTAEDDYAGIAGFAEKYSGVSYREFDSHLLKRVNLFALPEYYDFDALLAVLGRIISTLPSIKRIFARPISRLKDNSVILPAEAVQVINNRTIIHASAHSELWENITDEGLKPRKLMTLNHIDTYSIYENIAFVKAVNMILRFVGKNMKLLRNMLYAHRDINVNLLERENHLSYFLAIGKLHIGYVRDYDKQRATALNCLDKLVFIDRVVRSRINCPLYAQCEKQSRKPLSLKKTNIFRAHKDYRAVYNLLKWFEDTSTETELEDAEFSAVTTPQNYSLYCSMLSVFAAGHFNFEFADKELINFAEIDTEAVFGEWRLKISRVTIDDADAIVLKISKDGEYKIALLPSVNADCEGALELLKSRVDADEYIVADPTDGGTGRVYLSLYDLDSFRRLQQIYLRGMIKADITRDVCPFCGKPLSLAEDGKTYECDACRMQIFTQICPKSEREYTVTGVKNLMPDDSTRVDPAVRRDRHLLARYAETRMYFRNITPIAEDRTPVCPYCNTAHR